MNVTCYFYSRRSSVPNVASLSVIVISMILIGLKKYSTTKIVGTVEASRFNNQSKNETLMSSISSAVISVIFFLAIVLPMVLKNLKVFPNNPEIESLYGLSSIFTMSVIFPIWFFTNNKSAAKSVKSALFG